MEHCLLYNSMINPAIRNANQQQFQIWIDLPNQGRKFVVLVVLRFAQNNNKSFSYFESLANQPFQIKNLLPKLL